ncbi:type I-E CRISPR-associated protein Cse2/CasB [Allonocardiopsis opalescens]|uniref:CRISPR system Cascade subunit CasB n=1 Tax=Allonocardiopsis opalescens TaxID=1144618 RepID=A0A2T0PV51_9ACTN|nr:type I-E CRISPR-associated protein Cse2/CasB [Allonocardiopsis opalescens]PRX95415.1 CRISPR system Cascade subunit CasB [Allonocardiopsis opalescens]
MSATTTRERPQPYGAVAAFVHERVTALQRDYLRDRPGAVAALARLRRGAGRTLAEVPDLWGLAGGPELYDVRPPSHDSARAEAAQEQVETAAHIALTLFAVHQQSRRDAGMHRPGRGLGGAVRRLMPGNDIDEPLRKRFVQAGSATTTATLAYRLREIVVLLRGESIPLDYGLLAGQLHTFQQPGGINRVRLAWARDFHAHRDRAVQAADDSAVPDVDTTAKDQP